MICGDNILSSVGLRTFQQASLFCCLFIVRDGTQSPDKWLVMLMIQIRVIVKLNSSRECDIVRLNVNNASGNSRLES